MIRFLFDMLGYQRLFYQFVGWKLPALYLLIALGGVVEAFGIVALIPLLNVALGSSSDGVLSRFVVDMLAGMGIAATLGNMLMLMVLIFCLRGIITYLYTYSIAHIAATARRDMQIKLARRFGEMTFEYYASRPAGWFNNIIVSEVGRCVSSLRSMARLAVSGIHALIMLPLAVSLRPELTAGVFVLSGLVLYSLKGMIGRTATQSRDQTRNAGLLNAEFIQLIQSFIYLKATNTMTAMSRHVIAAINALRQNSLEIQRTSALISAIKEPIAVAVLAAFIHFEVGILGGSIAEAIVVALLIYRTMIQLVSLAPLLQTFNQTVGGVQVVQEVIGDLERHSERRGGEPVSGVKAPIEFRDVSFRHGETSILDRINLTVRPRETIGIVGASGAGKTTFFHLLTGILTPETGSITFGSVDSRDIDKNSLRDRIGYVTQEPVIFNDSVANNIALWSCDGSDDTCLKRIRKAARIAKCDEFVMAMPKRYQTKLGDRGIRLSGGERQRVAIARELFKNPELLIFDEAASALDAESERYVQESIERMHGERTIVVITHRLASVRYCDRIYVFQAGKVVQSGTFEALYGKRRSYFRRLCDQQGVAA